MRGDYLHPLLVWKCLLLLQGSAREPVINALFSCPHVWFIDNFNSASTYFSIIYHDGLTIWPHVFKVWDVRGLLPLPWKSVTIYRPNISSDSHKQLLCPIWKLFIPSGQWPLHTDSVWGLGRTNNIMRLQVCRSAAGALQCLDTALQTNCSIPATSCY